MNTTFPQGSLPLDDELERIPTLANEPATTTAAPEFSRIPILRQIQQHRHARNLVLEQAAHRVEQDWTRGVMTDLDGSVCLLGGIEAAADDLGYGGREQAAAVRATKRALGGVYRILPGFFLAFWNDETARNGQVVAEVLRDGKQ